MSGSHTFPTRGLWSLWIRVDGRWFPSFPGYMSPVEVTHQVAIRENMKGTPGIAGRAFGALGKKDVNVIAIAQGSSELSITFAVKSSDVKGAVQALHREFHL